MPSNDKKKKQTSLVTTLSSTFRKAMSGEMDEDAAVARKEHRARINLLIEEYMSNVQQGLIDGIRNAKDLVEVIKLDLLILAMNPETPQVNGLDEMRVKRIQQVIDADSPELQTVMMSVLRALNGANDEVDGAPVLSTMPTPDEMEEGYVEDQGDNK